MEVYTVVTKNGCHGKRQKGGTKSEVVECWLRERIQVSSSKLEFFLKHEKELFRLLPISPFVKFVRVFSIAQSAEFNFSIS